MRAFFFIFIFFFYQVSFLITEGTAAVPGVHDRDEQPILQTRAGRKVDEAVSPTSTFLPSDCESYRSASEPPQPLSDAEQSPVLGFSPPLHLKRTRPPAPLSLPGNDWKINPLNTASPVYVTNPSEDHWGYWPQ